MKTITLISFLIILSHISQAQVGVKRHITDKGIPPIQNISVLNIPDINPDMVVIAKEVRNAQYGTDAIAGVVNPISVGYDALIGGHYIKYDDPNITMASGRIFNVIYAPRDTPGSQNGNFTHTAIANSIFPVAPYATVIDNPLTNNDDTWNLVSSKNVDDNEIFNDLPVNLNYNFYGSGEWVIRCQPSFNIPINAEYNIIGDTSSVYLYDHITTPQNVDEIVISVTEYAYFSSLSHPFLNNNPDAIVFAEPIIPEGSGSSFYFEHSLYYNSNTGSHEIHLDLDTFPGSGYNFPTNITFKIYAANETSLSTTDISIFENLKAYPNPTQHFFNIEAHNTISEVELFNILGQKLEIIKGNGTRNIQMDVAKYSYGYYFAKVKAGNQIETIRFVKN
ncbi:T9SS type A sorting domain-containing protein [Winogradskyella flava]|uniref:T9SS type A sorting domain-containing protein n=1 Tax=Winogradskyella flava TaxID=1884876 RepID=A0A842IS81_9FLAO|nr:T9SS type A sorting domain-containing protein [Winogradskyella flava]MBC2843738.1 T9SS type A sorting domain-containing protein [Winogradskyella flava]